MASPFQAISSSSLPSTLPVVLSSWKLFLPTDVYLGIELGTEDFSVEVSDYIFGAVRLSVPLLLPIWA